MYGRHLLQNSSMTLDTVSDLTRDILELADNDITDKVTDPPSALPSPHEPIPVQITLFRSKS